MEKVELILSSGLIVYCIKSIIEFYIRKKELRNKTFYEIKTKRILELHKKIIDIQVMVDRSGFYPLNEIHVLNDNEKKSIGKIKYEMDLDFWECEFYYNAKTCECIKELISYLYFFSDPHKEKNAQIEREEIQQIIKNLLKQLKKEIK